MKKLFSKAEFDSCVSTELLPLECHTCHCVFYREKKYISKAIKKTGRDKQFYCSNTCQNLKQSPPVIVKCALCGKPFRKQPKEIKKSKNAFCSHSHAAKWNNAHKKHGTRISKMERWIAKQLPSLFPDLEFHFNQKDTINSELDIYIPSLHLAFELNGIYHYEPIHGPKKLGSIQNNDERKFQACLETGIELCIIDISSVSYFKPKKAQKFLDIICSVINTKTLDILIASQVLLAN